jgi:hypothetical protein
MSETPTLAGVIRSHIAAQLDELHVALPARVESYDASRQAVSVQPLIRHAYRDESAERQVESLPMINDVPVVFPGAAGYRVTFPIAAGDTVLLVIASASIDKWLKHGGEGDPLLDHRHRLRDAIAIPGLRSFADALSDAPTDKMTIGKDDGPIIDIDGDTIKISQERGSTPYIEVASDFVHLGSDKGAFLALKSDVQTIRDDLHLHEHVAPGGGGATTGGPSVTEPTGTTLVKGK